MKKQSVTEELQEAYRTECDGMDVLLRLTPLEAEHIVNLLSLGTKARRRALLGERHKEGRKKPSEYEKHLFELDNTLHRKAVEAMQLALPDKKRKRVDQT